LVTLIFQNHSRFYSEKDYQQYGKKLTLYLNIILGLCWRIRADTRKNTMLTSNYLTIVRAFSFEEI